MVKKRTGITKQDVQRLSRKRGCITTINRSTVVSNTKKEQEEPKEKSLHMDKEEIKFLINEERLEEAGKLLLSFGHKGLGAAVTKFAGILPYVSSDQYSRALQILGTIVDKQYAMKKTSGEGDKNEKEYMDTLTFTNIKDAMLHYTQHEEEEEAHKRKEKKKEKEAKKQKDMDDIANMFRSAKFKPLPSTIQISVVRGDIVIIGRVSSIEKAIDGAHEIRTLSYSEAIVKDVDLLGIREDRILIPSLVKRVKRGEKKKTYIANREKKAKKQLITLETLSRMVERKFPKKAITGQHVYSKPHCYYPLLPYKVFCPPCSPIVMGKIMPALKKWYILGLA